MPSDASIYNLVGQGVTPLQNPLDIEARKIAIRNALSAGTLQDQQIAQGQFALEQQRRAAAQDLAFQHLFNSAGAQPTAQQPAAPAVAPPVDASSGIPGVSANLPTAPAYTGSTAPPAAAAPGMAGAGAMSPRDISDDQILGSLGPTRGYAVIHARNESNHLAAQANKLNSDARDANRNYWGSLAYALDQGGYDPNLVKVTLATAAHDGMDKTPQFQMLAGNINNPGALKLLASQAMAASPDVQKLLVEKTNSSISAATQAETGRHNVADEQNAATRETETVRHDKADEHNAAVARAQEQQNINLRVKTFQQMYGNPLDGATDQELAVAKMRAAGTAPLPSSRTKGYDRSIALAASLDPTFAQYAGTRFDTLKNFREKGEANNLVGITTVLGHLDRALANSKELGYEPTIGLNWSPKQHALHQDLMNVQSEVSRLIGGVVSEGETNRMLGNLESSSQTVRDTALNELKELMGSKFEGIVQKFKNGTGQALPITMFDAPTQERLRRNGLTQGLDFGGAAPAAAPTPAAPGGAPAAAPRAAAAPAAGSHADLKSKSDEELFRMLGGAN